MECHNRSDHCSMIVVVHASWKEMFLPEGCKIEQICGQFIASVFLLQFGFFRNWSLPLLKTHTKRPYDLIQENDLSKSWRATRRAYPIWWSRKGIPPKCRNSGWRMMAEWCLTQIIPCYSEWVLFNFVTSIVSFDCMGNFGLKIFHKDRW